jgi:hypothetical protein
MKDEPENLFLFSRVSCCSEPAFKVFLHLKADPGPRETRPNIKGIFGDFLCQQKVTGAPTILFLKLKHSIAPFHENQNHYRHRQRQRLDAQFRSPTPATTPPGQAQYFVFGEDQFDLFRFFRFIPVPTGNTLIVAH